MFFFIQVIWGPANVYAYTVLFILFKDVPFSSSSQIKKKNYYFMFCLRLAWVKVKMVPVTVESRETNVGSKTLDTVPFRNFV
jgi:hypothetical protein